MLIIFTYMLLNSNQRVPMSDETLEWNILNPFRYYFFMIIQHIVRMSSKSVRYLSCACYLFILVILEKTIRIPRSLSVKAAGILKGFLNKNPTDRLGCHKESRFMEIQTHPFFKSIEWEAVSFQRPFKQILLNLG